MLLRPADGLVAPGEESDHAPAPRTLADIRQQGTLRALTDGSSTGAARDSDGLWRGFQYEILKRFADSLGMQLAVTPVDDLSRCIGELATGHYDLVAAAMPPTVQWGYALDFTRPLMLSRQMLVQRADSLTGQGTIMQQHQLAGDTVYIPQGSPHRMCLQHLSDEIADTIYIIGIAYTNPEKLAEGVAAGRVKHTIVHEQLARKPGPGAPQPGCLAARELGAARLLGGEQAVRRPAGGAKRLPRPLRRQPGVLEAV